MSTSSDSGGFPWRLVILGPVAVTLFALAIYFYNNLEPEVGLTLLGSAFAIAMVWVVLAARDADSGDTLLRTFIPRLTTMLVLGSAFLGYMMWIDNQPQISAIEAGFIAFYIAMAALALHICKAKPKRPQLTALSGGNLMPRQRRRSH